MTTFEFIEDPLTLPQTLGLWITGAISSVLSLTGSISLIVYFIRFGKWRGNPTSRIIVGLSIIDVIVTLQAFLTPFTFPKEIGLSLTFGNMATCQVQGFTTTFITGSSIYCFGLSLCYLLMIARNWKEEEIRKLTEIPIHVLAFGFPIMVGSYAWATDAISPVITGRFCGFAEYPENCSGDPDVECIRGTHPSHHLINKLNVLGLAAFSLLGILNTFLVVWIAARQLYKGRQNRNDAVDDRIKLMRTQAMLYCLAYFNTFFWGLAYTLIYNAPYQEAGLPKNYAFLILFIFFFPLQGAMNCFVWLRPRVRWRRANLSSGSSYSEWKRSADDRTKEIPRKQPNDTEASNSNYNDFG